MNNIIGVNFAPSLVTISSGDFRISYALGINYEFKFDSNISIKSGLNYESKGQTSKFIFVDENGSYMGTSNAKEINNYLILPLIGCYNFEIPLYINLGLYGGYLLSNKTEINNQTIGNVVMKKTDFGIIGGIGSNIKLTDELGLNLEIRVNRGFINIYNSQSASYYNIAYNFIVSLNYSLK